MKARRLVRDLALVMVFVPFAVVALAPVRWGCQGHPLWFVDPFAVVVMLVGGVVPPVVAVFGAVFMLTLCRLSPLYFCTHFCPLGALQRLLLVRRLGLASAGLARKLPRLGRVVLVGALLAGAFGLVSPALVDPLVLTTRGVQYVAGVALGGLEQVPLAPAVPFLLVVLTAIFLHTPWCRCACPVLPLLELIPRARSGNGDVVDAEPPLPPGGPVRLWTRRQVVLGAGVVALGAGGVWTRADGSDDPGPSLLRPPGALPGPLFLQRCIRCGQCQSACPTGIIVPACLQAGRDGMLTPILDFSRGVCPQKCSACQKVCPTGALATQSADERRVCRIGFARASPDLCVRPGGKLCRLCLESCPFNAITVGVPGHPSLPKVEPGLCTGCGVCENVCPVGRTARGSAIRVHPVWEVS
ncbi:MAG: 4Fe-4S dicluster domain-containing protein [Candidatus Riflebacteria bacterium]|nr:4Fe-4S dicluster domain-containing protein [Candidatus Riflebacteria bacterium]